MPINPTNITPLSKGKRVKEATEKVVIEDSTMVVQAIFDTDYLQKAVEMAKSRAKVGRGEGGAPQMDDFYPQETADELDFELVDHSSRLGAIQEMNWTLRDE